VCLLWSVEDADDAASSSEVGGELRLSSLPRSAPWVRISSSAPEKVQAATQQGCMGIADFGELCPVVRP